MANVNTRYQVLQQQLGMTSQQAKTSADLSQAPAVKDALTELQDAESQLAVEKTRLTDNHPTIIELESKVATLKGMLQGRVGEVSGDRASQSTGNLQMGQLEQDLTKELVSLENNRFGLESQVDSLKNLQNNYQQQQPPYQQGYQQQPTVVVIQVRVSKA